MGSSATVVGAGVAGLVAAAGLARLGWDVSVVEQAPTPREDGAGLTLWPNAVRSLDALGLGDAVRGIGEPVHRAVVRRADGRLLNELPIPALTARYGPLLAVRRTDLHRVLADAFPGPVTYGRAATVVDGEVLVAGRSPESTLVVGADGVDSAVRPVVVAAVRRRGTGQFAARGVARTGDSTSADTTEWWGRGLRFGLVPLRGGLSYWFAATTTRAAAENPQDTFVRWHAPIRDVLAAPQVGHTPVLSLTDLAPLGTWHDGRSTVLVGDAAHAMTPNLGQGAAQAIEDVAVLLEELASTSVPQALAAYEHRRKPRADQVVARSRFVGAVAQGAHPATAFVRDGLARVTPDRIALRQAAAVLDTHR